MYMIRSRSGTDDTYYPADRCTFRTVYSSNNYTISINPPAQFTNGATFADIPGADTAATRPVLGYICKTGRFVDMTIE